MEFEEFNSFWKNNGIIVFDTNVLLNLYNYPIESTKEIISALERISNRVWLPAQVIQEFENNKKKVSERAFSKYEKVKKDAEMLLNNTISSLHDTLGKCNKFKYPNFTDVIGSAITSIKQIKDDLSLVNSEIETEKRLNRELIENDIIQKMIIKIQDSGNVGLGFSHVELINIYVEGDTRFNLGIPPGFKDKKKMNESESDYKNRRKAYGDLIIWKEILTRAKQTPQEVLLITDDEKIDWWNFEIVIDSNTGRETKRLIGPHSELIEEFKAYSSKSFNMLTFTDFIEYLTKLRVVNSIELHYEINKEHILDYYIYSRIDISNINISYIIQDLDSFFDFKARKYDVNIRDIVFPENKEEIFMELREDYLSLSSRFILNLVVDGTIESDHERIIKSVLFEIECECNLSIEINQSEFRNYRVIDGDIKIINAVNNDVIAIVSDDIDVYEIYDLKIRFEKAMNRYTDEHISDYEYKLYEVFGHLQFYSLDEINNIEDSDWWL